MKHAKIMILILSILTLSMFIVISANAENTLTLISDPPEVLTIDPEALSMTLTDYPYVPVYIIDAEQTVTSGDTHYEFVAWGGGTENWPDDDPDYPAPPITGNQAFVVLDGPKTITAIYSQPNTLTLVSDPPEVLEIDPEALSMTLTDCPYVPVYIIDAEQTVVSGNTHYEFVAWGYGTEDWPCDPEDEPTLTGNQAFVVLDGPKVITAIYETIEEKWDIKLTGGLDYLEYEDIKVRVAALVTESSTGAPVSGADVTIDIYDENGAKIVSTIMVERLTGTGIYEYSSPQTIRRLMLTRKIDKGIYLVHVQALSGETPVASDIMEFHIDPPGENVMSTTTMTIAAIAALVSIITPLILMKKKHQ